MPRRIPPGRFDDLVRQATEVFIARGWRRTQMADIAEAVGVSKPTLYLYVESKEALFALCCEHADDPEKLALPGPDALPVPTPPAGEALRSLERRLARSAAMPELAAAAARAQATDLEAELRSIVEELYDVIDRNRCTLELLDRCWDHPEIGPAWLDRGRTEPRELLARVLRARIAAGQLAAHTEPRLLARIALETVVTWAMHIRWDRSPEPFDPVEQRRAVADFVLLGLLGRPGASPPTRPAPSTGGTS
jgi:AcrR family transcriptional regulator